MVHYKNRGKKRKKYFLAAAACLAACCIQACPCLAMDSYESVVQGYGDRAGDYTYDTTAKGEAIQEVITFSKKEGKTYTETYIRKEASAESEHCTVIPKDTHVLIYGFTSNGWMKICCKNTELGDIYGYIRGDLLQDV